MLGDHHAARGATVNAPHHGYKSRRPRILALAYRAWPLSPAQLRDLELAAEGCAIDHSKLVAVPCASQLRTGGELSDRGYVEQIGTFGKPTSRNGRSAPAPRYQITLRGMIRVLAERSHRKHCRGCKLCVCPRTKRAVHG